MGAPIRIIHGNISNGRRTFCSFQTIARSMALICLAVAFSYSQKTIRSGFNKNEAKLNMFYLPGGYGELSYERILGDKSALGVAVGLLIDSEGTNYVADIVTYDMGILPYFRYYFGRKRAAGFFLEANVLVFSREEFENGKDEWGLGVGLAFGVKLLHKRDWCLDVFLGGGGMFEAHKDSDTPQPGFIDLNFPDVYPRLGVSIGKRF